MRKRSYVFVATLLVLQHPCAVQAQNTLKVSGVAWHGLSDAERASIQTQYVVEALAPESYGLVVDNQGADRSTPGNIAGSSLGEAVASAAYIDKALDGGDYSAKSHLGAALLGGILGSALNSKPQAQYQFRYTIRLGSGKVVYQDAFSSDPFRHSVGVCLTIPNLSILPEQHICNQTTETLRNAHFLVKKDLTRVNSTPTPSPDSTPPTVVQSESKTATVTCKVGALAPIITTREKCLLIEGVIL